MNTKHRRSRPRGTNHAWRILGQIRNKLAKYEIRRNKSIFAQFESAAVEIEGVECWSARELQSLLGYSQWRRFAETIEERMLDYERIEARAKLRETEKQLSGVACTHKKTCKPFDVGLHV